jgi:hypothetical protein
LVGCGESHREGPPGYFRPLKVHTYKEGGATYKIRREGEEIKEEALVVEEEKTSAFCKINQRYVGAPVSTKTAGFLIGPVFDGADQNNLEIFAPKIFIKSEGG